MRDWDRSIDRSALVSKPRSHALPVADRSAPIFAPKVTAMPSLRDGDYRMVGAIQGSSPDRWYRQLIDARQPQRAGGDFRLSCDCPAWINNQTGDRTCKHTQVTARLLRGEQLSQPRP